MQHFINHAAIERWAAELLSGARARYYLLALLALLTAVAAGPALAAVWLGAALLAQEFGKAVLVRSGAATPKQARLTALAVELAGHASLAAAPLITWRAGGAFGLPLAVAMLCVLLADAALHARRGRLHAASACAPYGGVGLLMLFSAASPQAAVAIAGCGGAFLYCFAAILHRTHGADHARMQDAEWVRQLNMSFGEDGAAAWEIDFSRQRLVGAHRLSRLLGRDIGYRDIVERGCLAAAADRPLAIAAFAPTRGPVRRIALEHDALAADGGVVRLRHNGFLRTAPDGAPLRLTCVTRPSTASVRAGGVADEAASALALQRNTLRTLRNELPSLRIAAAAEAGAENPPALLAALTACSADIERGVEELARSRHAAESANLAKSQFLANMSHELRTPLNAIIGYAEMLMEDAADNGDETASRDLDRILSAARHLLSLINEILDLSKIEAGRMEAAPIAFDPAAMLEEAIETVRPLAEQNGNVISLKADPGIGEAFSDATKLRQCVLNLLSNACKFTRGGSIEIGLAQRECNGVSQLFVSVRDTGIGMSPTHLARLFQPFVQADPTITQHYGGTGLGLTITRRLAQLLGGDVLVESVLGEGSLFTLHAPADFGDAAKARGAAAAVDAVQGVEGAPLVLVIEDEADARDLAARALTRAGFSVLGVGGGEAGLTLAREKAPALVLLDIFLPDRSGWRVLQSLKHDPRTSDIPVVVLSVNEDRAHALALGAAEHMIKPADRDRLAATVMRYARKRPPQQEAAAETPLSLMQAG